MTCKAEAYICKLELKARNLSILDRSAQLYLVQERTLYTEGLHLECNDSAQHMVPIKKENNVPQSVSQSTKALMSSSWPTVASLSLC